MCGIAGRFNFDPLRPVDRDVLVAMTDAVAHRGPDASGYYSAPGIGLGHRRLSIIDLSTGDQPLTNEDGTVWVVFNGEIYNFAEVRAELASAGHRFRTSSDTEVIVHGYEQWGERCVDRFRGMFAFALWDANREDASLEQLDALLAESVALRQISDVPLGAFLSGGIDSTTVVAYMRQTSDRPPVTISVGFDHAAYDEVAHAETVARHLGCE